jgi:zinc transport system ATP-binding protein
MSTLLTLDKLNVGYAGRALLPPVSLAIAREELWALVGRNGSGKTTLLRTLLGLLPKVGGTYKWSDGVHIGYVPQRSEFDLSVPMRSRDVVAMGLDSRMSFMKRTPNRDQIEAVLKEVNMEKLSDTSFSAMSDGQRQRVLLARALASNPDVLILDEPTNGMDLAAERAAFDLFARLKTARRLALIVVSHHMSMLGSRASHVLWVDKDEGHVVSGDLETVRRNASFALHYGTVFGPESPAVAAALTGGAT